MRALALLVCLALACGLAVGGTIVLPNAQTSSVGNDSSGSLALSFASGIAQDIWSSSQLASLGGSVLITQLAFRLKPGTGSINATATSFALYLSTTSLTPSTMTTTFASNRGADYTQVFSGAGTLWSSPGCTGPAVCPFDIVYNFGTPFLYNPAAGNLLIEEQFTGYNGVGTGQFDVQNYFSAAGSPIGELTAFPTAATGALEYSDNITRLTFTSTPEPSVGFMTLCGLGALAAFSRRIFQVRS